MLITGSTSANPEWTDSEDDIDPTSPSGRLRSHSLVTRSSDGVPSHSSFSPSSSEVDEIDHRPAPTREEIASYRSFLRDLEAGKPGLPLTARLLQTLEPSRSVRAGPTSVTAPSLSSATTDATQSYIEPSSVAKPKIDESKLDHRWPLDVNTLKDEPKSLDEILKAVATRIILDKHLVLPRHLESEHEHQEQGEGELNVESGPSSSGARPTVNDAEDFPLPSDLVESTTVFVNRLLANLAATRPRVSRNKRKKLAPIGWEGLISVATLLPDSEE